MSKRRMPSAVPLSYQESRTRWPFGPRRLIASTVIVSVVMAGLFWGPGLWWKVQVLYWQGRCLRYTAPVDRIVPNGAPPEWKHFYALAQGQRPGDGTVFLHERVSSAGDRRLVAVDYGCGTLFARVFVPGTLSNPPREVEQLLGASTTIPADAIIYAGQPDLADASHFTISYSLNRQRYVIDGWLSSNGLVSLEPRWPLAAR